MVKTEKLIEVRTIKKSHLKQLVCPSYKIAADSLFKRVLAAVESGAAECVGWVWKAEAGDLRNEMGHGEYYASQALYAVEWDGQLFLMPVDDRWTADSDKYGKQLFV